MLSYAETGVATVPKKVEKTTSVVMPASLQKVTKKPKIDKKNWMYKLGGMQKSSEAKKSYMRGLLLKQKYGSHTTLFMLEKEQVLRLYAKYDYETLWIAPDYTLNPNLFEMLSVLRSIEDFGLEGVKYHLVEIEAILDELKQAKRSTSRERNLLVAQVDVLLSDAFLAVARDLRESEINFEEFSELLKRKYEEEEIRYVWENPNRSIKYITFFESVRARGNLKKSLLGLSTHNEMFLRLKEAYLRYQNIAKEGGWQKIPYGKKLRVGMYSPKRVTLLAKRLHMTEDLPFLDQNLTKMTTDIRDALVHYQKRMGLWASGTLTEATRKSLNVPVEQRVAKIKLNMERARWENKPFGAEYVWINIPDFKMQFIKDGMKDIEMKVVVGKKKNPTPIFTSMFSYMVLNPTWTVPESIVQKEMLSRIQEDPDYLETRRFKLYKGKDKNGKEIDGFNIDWWEYDEKSELPFSFVRDPGVGNPLGRVKFMFPNKYAVYMHDTPEKNLFKNSKRAYSHGCIRLGKPQALLTYMVDHYTSVPFEAVVALQEAGETESVPLDSKIPVYIRYYTAWSDEEGFVSFRNDIYGYDQMQSLLFK